ncbi:MAG: alanine racemase [Candidatus Hydrothermales bacterium]
MENSKVPYCEVNLKNLKYNLRQILKNTNLPFFPVIKTDAYGVGLVEVSKALFEEGVKNFCIGDLDEAFKLSDSKIEGNIVILNPVLTNEIPECIKKEFVFPIWDKGQIKDIKKFTNKLQKKARIQIEIDTGLGRNGVPMEKAYNLVEELLNSEFIERFGIFTHFSKAENDKSYTEDQIGKFLNFINTNFSNKEKFFKFIHASNSASFLLLRDKVLSSPFNSFRLGLLLYGVLPNSTFKNFKNLKPVLKVASRILKVETLSRGSYIGYGGYVRLRKNTKIGVVNFGYSRGLNRNVWEKGYFIVNKKRAKILGTLSMDLSVVDLSHIPETRVGDEVIIVGNVGKDEINFNDIADWSLTIPHEVFVKITSSLSKVYKL